MFVLPLFLASCESELMGRQEEEILRLQQEIARQRQELDQIKQAKLKRDRKRQSCNRAFGQFVEAQKAKDPPEAVQLYRKGLRLCPDDDVARYELGKILISVGKSKEAAEEFAAALKINPDFKSARRELDSLRKRNK